MNSRCFKLLRAYSIYFVYFVKCWQMFLELNSKRLHQSSGKEKESCCLVFSSSTKRKFRNFHVVVVQQRQKNVPKKRDARAKLFCYSKPIAFLPFSVPSPSSLLKLPNMDWTCRVLAPLICVFFPQIYKLQKCLDQERSHSKLQMFL